MKDKSASLGTQPQLSGVGRRGRTVSLQSLAHQGAVILGRLLDVDGHTLVVGDDAAANVRFADEFSQRRKADIDAYLARARVPLPPIEDDQADEPDLDAECASPERRFNLQDAQVGTIIWATGFTAKFDWIRLPILDGAGMPIHERGVSPVPGIYFVGLPWLYKRKSGFIYGIAEDAQYIVNIIARQFKQRAENNNNIAM